MDYAFASAGAESRRAGCLVLLLGKDLTAPALLSKLPAAARTHVESVLKQGDLSSAAGQHLLLPKVPELAAERLLLVALGQEATLKPHEFIKVVQAVARAVLGTQSKDVLWSLDGLDVEGQDHAWVLRQVVLEFEAARYKYSATKGGDKASNNANAAKLAKVRFQRTGRKRNDQSDRLIKQALGIAQGVATARELGNLPANVCTPVYLASQARSIARGCAKLSVKVLEEKQLRELKMGAFLSVAAGSVQPPRLIIMEYRGAAKSVAPHVLVGKGITFDTGGISIKPAAAMDEMKFDMCGAASVLGTMHALAELQPKVNVVGLVAAAENMPSGTATKPGDVVTSMSGQTIEVLNTDAEGRLVLFDALTYAERYKPQSVVDIATLTGACVVALGHHAHGLFSNQPELQAALEASGATCHDRAWPMPLWPEYQPALDSNFADIANVGGRYGGAITAACFLSRFTQAYAWAHLDIAGTAWISGGKEKGATGRPVPLLTQYLLNQEA